MVKRPESHQPEKPTSFHYTNPKRGLVIESELITALVGTRFGQKPSTMVSSGKSFRVMCDPARNPRLLFTHLKNSRR